MWKRNDKIEFLGVCYFPSPPSEPIVPNVVPEDVFYIEVITSGEALYQEGVKQHLCRKGTLLWHKGGDETIWQRHKGLEFVVFAMRFKLLEKWSRPGHVGRWESINELDEFVVKTMRFTFESGVDNQIFGNYLINRLYWEFYAGSLNMETNCMPVALSKALTLMQNDDVSSMGLGSVAEISGVSLSHLYVLFREHLNTTPYRYMSLQRLKKARILLSGTNLPIKEVCYKCGFASLESFHRVFRKHNALTPAEFRRRHLALLQTDILKSKKEIQQAEQHKNIL